MESVMQISLNAIFALNLTGSELSLVGQALTHYAETTRNAAAADLSANIVRQRLHVLQDAANNTRATLEALDRD